MKIVTSVAPLAILPPRLAIPCAFVRAKSVREHFSICFSRLRSARELDDMLPRAPARRFSTIELPGDDAKPIKPALVGGRARETDLPADGLPSLAVGAEPDDLGVSRFKPMKPA